MSDKKNTKAKNSERITNLYMIQLSLGILGIIILMIFNTFYKTPGILIHMQKVTWILTGVFASTCGGMVIGGIAKKHSHTRNYGILMGICALITLWLSLFNKIRPVLEDMVQSITGNALLAVNSYWNTRVPIILIAVYLVVAFIVYCVKLAKKK